MRRISYFSTDQALDLAVASQLAPKADYQSAMLANMNYEGGCNPVNVCYVSGLGWRRTRNLVSQLLRFCNEPGNAYFFSRMFSGFKSQCISLALLSKLIPFNSCCANTRTSVVLSPLN